MSGNYHKLLIPDATTGRRKYDLPNTSRYSLDSIKIVNSNKSGAAKNYGILYLLLIETIRDVILNNALKIKIWIAFHLTQSVAYRHEHVMLLLSTLPLLNVLGIYRLI